VLQLLLQQSSKSVVKIVEIVNSRLVVKLLQKLLSRQVPVRSLSTIADTLAVNRAKSQNFGAFSSTEFMSLNRVIAQSIYGSRVELPVFTLDVDLERFLPTY